MTCCLIDSRTSIATIATAATSAPTTTRTPTTRSVSRERFRLAAVLVRLARRFAAIGSFGDTALSEQSLSRLSQRDRLGERR